MTQARISIHPDSFQEDCAFCGKPHALKRSDDETCEGCAFCDAECEAQYLDFIANELEAIERGEDPDDEEEA